MDRGSQSHDPSILGRMLVAGMLASLFFIVDQVSKVIVRDAVAHGFSGMDLIPGVVGLRYVENIGASFSLGEGFAPLFAVLAIVVTAFCIVYLLRAPRVSWLEVAGMGMVVGGALGNAVDRMLFGFVTDFIATLFVSFPVFNIADIGITCGAVLAFIGFAFGPAGGEGKGE